MSIQVESKRDYESLKGDMKIMRCGDLSITDMFRLIPLRATCYCAVPKKNMFKYGV